MNAQKLPLLLLLSAFAATASAQEDGVTLQQERDRMGTDLQENRQQIGRDINRIREPGAAPNQLPGANRGGVQSDADNPRPRVPGAANPPAGTRLPGTRDNLEQPTDGAPTSPAPGTMPPPTTPGAANGNANPAGVTPPGGIGTGGGNAAPGAARGGATTGGPTGGAAGQR